MTTSKASDPINLFPFFCAEEPEVKVFPVYQRVKIGGSARIGCYGKGNPSPSIHWLHNGKKVEEEEGGAVVSEGGWVGGWMGGWVDGWVSGWVVG